MAGTQEVRDFVLRRSDTYLRWLEEACSIPSMAGEPEALTEMAGWLGDKFDELGARNERLDLGDHPDAVLAEIGEGERTVLVYDHYDVQPVDPIELWESKPFSPEIRDGVFYARGAADNKGDLIARLAALDVYKEIHGDIPVKMKFLVEGEEETGSKSFPELVERYNAKLTADGCIWEGIGIDHLGRPELVFGAKGLAYVELNYTALADDQHSSLAVVAPSAAWHLVEALSTLRDPSGRVLIEGFYDDVEDPTDADIALLEALPFEEEAERTRLGIDNFIGDTTGIELLKKYYFEPTCNIAGIVSGFIVPGTSKTVLPKQAMAKLDLRLVPDQDPAKIVELLRKHLDSNGYGDINIDEFSMEHPVRSPADSLIGKAAIDAANEVFERDPAVSPMMIGTGPMHPVAATLGIPTVSPAGVCRPDSNIHAPNENVRIEDFLKIVEYSVAWMRSFAEVS
jgi:acetylornithine deacetylase/succinyl-diaminopimelate desuccinylase-like protein